MTKMTITEALAEIKLINSKLDKKRARVLENLIRYEHETDPFAHEGGSSVYCNAEVQSIEALEENIAKIRSAIMSANLSNSAEVMGKTRTLYEWLVWKRDLVEKQKYFYLNVYTKSKERIEYLHKNPHTVGKPEAGVTPELAKIKPSLQHADFSKKHEEVCDVLSKLDGVLSLKNATIVIDVNL